MRHKYRKIGIRRGLGGWGDVQMSLAAAELYAREKDELVTYGCLSELTPLGDNVPGVQVVPLEEFDSLSFQRIWDLTDPCIKYEKSLEPHVDKNRTEIFARKMGLKGKPAVKVYLTEKETGWARSWIDEMRLDGRFLLGVVPKSYSWARDWHRWVELLYLLEKRAPDIAPLIFLAGVRSWEEIEYAALGTPIIGYSMREMLALISMCHLVAGVDTGPMHSAVGLGIPTVWVFTHIDGKIRTRGYPKSEVVQRRDLPCCPCWYDSRCHDPRQYMFCKNITVEQIARRVTKHYGRWSCSSSSSRQATEKPRRIWETGTASLATSP